MVLIFAVPEDDPYGDMHVGSVYQNVGLFCASAGLGPAKDPSRTGTVNYYLCGKDVLVVENEGKAIGSFIMASVEYEQRAR